MKVGDVVIVASDHGTIEEITLTHVVVKVWDLRRIILPITYFLENQLNRTLGLVAPRES